MAAGTEYTFNIVNFTKNDSLFNYGMLPATFSRLEYERTGKGWQRSGREVSYKRGPIPRENSRRHYYRLSFKLTGKYLGDSLSIAHSYPYTFSTLKSFMADRVGRNKQIVSKIHIGKTIAKNSIEALQITIPINRKRDNRKAIIIMARQHPGETQGSYVCEGVVDRWLSRTKEGEFLRKHFVVYVIPMVNPDGVVFGHYRTNLAGNDLNRKWDISAGEKEGTSPEVSSIKLFIQ